MTATHRPRVLQIGKMPLPALDADLAQEFDTTVLSAQADPQQFLADHGSEFAYLVTSASMGASASVIQALPALRGISSFGVGFDALDQDARHRYLLPCGWPCARRPPSHQCEYRRQGPGPALRGLSN